MTTGKASWTVVDSNRKGIVDTRKGTMGGTMKPSWHRKDIVSGNRKSNMSGNRKRQQMHREERHVGNRKCIVSGNRKGIVWYRNRKGRVGGNDIVNGNRGIVGCNRRKGIVSGNRKDIVSGNRKHRARVCGNRKGARATERHRERKGGIKGLGCKPNSIGAQ